MESDNNRGSADNEVGYGRPPKRNQIAPGEVRNPYGRKGKPRQSTDFMDGLFEISIEGRRFKVTRNEAVDYGLFHKAMKGCVSAAKELERRRKERALAAENVATEESLASGDQNALDRYVQRLLDERQAAQDNSPKAGLPIRGAKP